MGKGLHLESGIAFGLITSFKFESMSPYYSTKKTAIITVKIAICLVAFCTKEFITRTEMK